MSFKIIVLAKQVPDTRNVGKDAMKEDGTVNRAALPAIFNPEDLNALEMALQIKDSLTDAKVFVVTMGPSRAAEIIREAMYRGADGGYVINDRKFAGSDTLATSYALALAVKQLAPYSLLLTGRQAIDGDTAQVGPQTAEKLHIPQITCAEECVNVTSTSITIKRRIEQGTEIVKTSLPALITVLGSAQDCRPRKAKLTMKYKYAKSASETLSEHTPQLNRPYLIIEEWSADNINANESLLGLGGSPTKVKNIENVVLAHKESQFLNNNDEEINLLMKELIASHIIG